MKYLTRLKFTVLKPHLANGMALIAATIYIAQSIYYALTQMSMLDEGQFLYKGLLYAMGVYRPYQDYGFWTHKAPLSYLIPGYIQMWFGPGLLVGRVYAIAIGILGLLGLWMAARRLGGNWWAAATVWAMALNPTIIKFYSVASAEGLVFCLLVWGMFFALGEKRPVYQLVISAVLATVMVFCRQNMLPVLPLLLIYIWWQYGFRSFAWAAAASLVIFTGVHALYWPGILRMWASVIPHQLAPFLDPWRPPQGLSADWIVQIPLSMKLTSFFDGFRFHFTALAGGLAAILFAARKKDWKGKWLYKTYVFLAITFVILTLLHLWLGTGNSDSNNYNAWGFTPYLSFFVPTGLLLIVLTFSAWKRKMSKLLQCVAVLTVIVLSTGIGLSTYETFGNTLKELHTFWVFNHFVRNIPIPRWDDFFLAWRLSGETIPLIDVLANKLAIDILVLTNEFDRRLDPAVIGLLIGLSILLLSLVAWKVLPRGARSARYSYGAIAMIVFLGTGALLSPTVLLGGDYKVYDCGCNVIANFEETGRSLAELVPPGSTVYWDGNAISVLLYLPDIHIYPPQIDGGWSYWSGGDPDALARYGFWNEELKLRWALEADIILVQQTTFSSSGWEFLYYSSQYEELNLDHIPLGCSPDTYLRVFLRKE